MGGATLRAFGVRVVGNVQGENARKVAVRDGKENEPAPVGGGDVVQGQKGGPVLGALTP